MIGQQTNEVDRKVVAILRVLSGSQEPVGGRVIARLLKDHGIDLSERAVRYHLKLMDERGLTFPVDRRDGRLITALGLEELDNALVKDKVGSVIARIESLAFQTSFDLDKQTGAVPINTSLFPTGKFRQALEAMKDTFKANLCVSNLVAVASEGEKLGETIVPQGKVGFATVSSVVVSGVLLKVGISFEAKFGGILQIRNYKPHRFVELIEYAGSSLNPCEIFMIGRMTNVDDGARRGEGKMLAHFREIPALSRDVAEAVIKKLKMVGINSIVIMGKPNESLCEISVGFNKIGVILLSGLNPVAAAMEEGIEAVNHAMSGVIDFRQLKSFWELEKQKGDGEIN